MNKGVELLLARMNSNPEEFERGGKWEWVIDGVMSRAMDPLDSAMFLFLTEEEVEALYRGILSVQSEAFVRKVMSGVLGVSSSVDMRTLGGGV